MRFESLLRVMGTLVYGFIGWELGVAIAQTATLTMNSARYILPATLLGAFGFAFWRMSRQTADTLEVGDDASA